MPKIKRVGCLAFLLVSMLKADGAMADDPKRLAVAHPVQMDAIIAPSTHSVDRPILELILSRIQESPNGPLRLEVLIPEKSGPEAHGPIHVGNFSFYSFLGGAGREQSPSGTVKLTTGLSGEAASLARTGKLPLEFRLKNVGERAANENLGSVEVVCAIVRGQSADESAAPSEGKSECQKATIQNSGSRL